MPYSDIKALQPFNLLGDHFSPIIAVLRTTFDLRLGARDQRSYMGPPSTASDGEAYCSR